MDKMNSEKNKSQNAISKEEEIKFQKWETVSSVIEADRKSVLFISFGTQWCYPSRKLMKHLSQFSNIEPKIKAFFVNQEQCRDLCRKYDVIVGTPFTMIYYGGRNMMFARGEWEPTKIIKGMLNKMQLQELYESTRSAIEMNAQEIYVKF